MDAINNKDNVMVAESCHKGVIVMNTGTPAALDRKSVKCFIGDMLSDPYVMGMPEWVCRMLARKIIAPLRASSSLDKYSLIWGESEVSPLMLNTLALADSIETEINMPVVVAMRYGYPSPEQALELLKRRCPELKEVVLLPLFPQYAESSYLTAVEAVKEIDGFKSGEYALSVVRPYYNALSYIDALADNIKTFMAGEDYHLVFSYHSLPLSHVEAGKIKGADFDYEYQCRETARLVAGRLGLNDTDYSIAYASAVGKKWLRPMLDDVAGQLPVKGIKKIAVAAPGFLIDNLETLYDIDINARRIFMEAGGESFLFIPSLNNSFSHAAVDIIVNSED